MSFNDFAIYALNAQLGDIDDKSMVLLEKLAKWVLDNNTKNKFDDDITLQVFHHLRDTAELRSVYDNIVYPDQGKKDVDAMISLHRRIGRMVISVLDAKVKSRSKPINPEIHLIRTFSYLEKDSLL